MRCEVCNAELANSEELKDHMERVHPLDERGEQGEDELEKPDKLDEPEKLAPIIPGKN